MSSKKSLENKVRNTPAGGAMIGTRKGQTIIHKDGTMGGYLVGKMHSEAGIKAVNKSNGQALELQGNEVVITAPAVADQTLHEFNGKKLTNRQILSQINEAGGGVSFADGGQVPAKIHTTEKKYTYKGKKTTGSEIAHHCGCNASMKNGGQVFSFFDQQYDIDKAYKMIQSGLIMYDIKEIDTFEAKHRFFDKEYSKNLKPDFAGAQGLMIKYKNGNDLLIDGNHRITNAHDNGLKKMKVYYITDPKTIAKFSKKTKFALGGNVAHDTVIISSCGCKHAKKENEFAKGGAVSKKARQYKYPDLSTIEHNNTIMKTGGAVQGQLSLDIAASDKKIISNVKTAKVVEIDITKGQEVFLTSKAITSPEDSYAIFREYWDQSKINVVEQLNVLLVNKGNMPIGIYQHSKGGTDSTVADVEVICAVAVKSLAKGVIICHNHPSGSLKPSGADKNIAEKLKNALGLFGIMLLDSLIVIPSMQFYSLASNLDYADGGIVPAQSFAKGGAVATETIITRNIGKVFSYEYGSAGAKITSANKERLVTALKEIISHYFFDWNFYYNYLDRPEKNQYVEVFNTWMDGVIADPVKLNKFEKKYLHVDHNNNSYYKDTTSLRPEYKEVAARMWLLAHKSKLSPQVLNDFAAYRKSYAGEVVDFDHARSTDHTGDREPIQKLAYGGSVNDSESELSRAKAELVQMLDEQDRMKKGNAVIRSKKNVETQLKALKFTDKEIYDALHPRWGAPGFPSYSLTNLNGRIKARRDKITTLEAKVSATKKVESGGSEEKYVFPGGYILVNYPEDRVQIFHDQKPASEVRDRLKRNGYHYSYTNEAWQRKITPQAISNARYLFSAVKEETDEPEETPVEDTRQYTMQDIVDRRFSYVSVHLHDRFPQGYTGPMSINLVYFSVISADIKPAVIAYIKKEFPTLNIEPKNINVYAKTYVNESKELFKNRKYLPGDSPANIVLAPVHHALKNFLAMQADTERFAEPDRFVVSKFEDIVKELEKKFKIEGYNPAAKALTDSEAEQSVTWLKNQIDKYPTLKEEVSSELLNALVNPLDPVKNTPQFLPDVYYHGTSVEGINELRLNPRGLLFFTKDLNIAHRYATGDFEGNTKSTNVFKRRLSVKNIFDPEQHSENPVVIDLLSHTGYWEKPGRNADFDQLAKQALEDGEWSALETEEFIAGLKELGYDAIYIDNRPYYSENMEGFKTFNRDIAIFNPKDAHPVSDNPPSGGDEPSNNPAKPSNPSIPAGFVDFAEATKVTSSVDLSDLPQGFDEGTMEHRSQVARDREDKPPVFTEYPIGTRAVCRFGEVHELKQLTFDQLVYRNEGTQRQSTIDKYVRWIQEGKKMLPLQGVENFLVEGGKVKITDGNHRCMAAKEAGLTSLPVWVALTDPNNNTRPVYAKDLIAKEESSPVEVKQPTTRESSFAAFSEALPTIMKQALAEQRPYRSAFLKRKNITEDQYQAYTIEQKEAIQKEWVKSKEFDEMNEESITVSSVIEKLRAKQDLTPAEQSFFDANSPEIYTEIGTQELAKVDEEEKKNNPPAPVHIDVASEAHDLIEYEDLPEHVQEIVDKYGDQNDTTEFQQRLTEAGYGTEYDAESFGTESGVTFYKLPVDEEAERRPLVPGAISGLDVWKAVVAAGSEHNDAHMFLHKQIIANDYKLVDLPISDLVKNDLDLKDFVNNGSFQKFLFKGKTRPVNHPIVIGRQLWQKSNDNNYVIDGYHRVGQSVINNAKTIKAYVPLDSGLFKYAVAPEVNPIPERPMIKLTNEQQRPLFSLYIRPNDFVLISKKYFDQHFTELQNKALVYETNAAQQFPNTEMRLTDSGKEFIKTYAFHPDNQGGGTFTEEKAEADKFTHYKGVSFSYKNAYELNKAIEEFIDHVAMDGSLDPAQKAFIQNYSGYGGLEKFGASGKGLLYEYFTPTPLSIAMWGLAKKYGYDGGRFMEPSCGIGEFIKHAPDPSQATGYEINEYSYKIAKLLYPSANIKLESFETAFIKNRRSVKADVLTLPKYKLVIGNPPYGEYAGLYAGMGEAAYTKADNWIDYFIFRGLDLLEKGGLLIFIIGTEVANGGHPWLQKGWTKTKKDIAAKSEMLDAYRLPNGVFDRTDVLTDIIVLRKK